MPRKNLGPVLEYRTELSQHPTNRAWRGDDVLPAVGWRRKKRLLCMTPDCRKPFISQNAGHRLCDRCRGRDDEVW